MSKAKIQNEFLSFIPDQYCDEQLVKNAQSWLASLTPDECSSKITRLTSILDEYHLSKTLTIESRRFLIGIQDEQIEEKLTERFRSFARFFSENFIELVHPYHYTKPSKWIEVFGGCIDKEIEGKCYYNDILTKLVTFRAEDLKYHMMSGIKTDRANYFKKNDSGWVIFWQRFVKDLRINPTWNDNAAIRWAAANDHLSVVQLLIEDGRVKNSNGVFHAVKSAAESGNKEMLCTLIASLTDDALKGLIRNHEFTPDVKIKLIGPLWKKFSLFANNEDLPKDIINNIALQYCTEQSEGSPACCIY